LKKLTGPSGTFMIEDESFGNRKGEQNSEMKKNPRLPIRRQEKRTFTWPMEGRRPR